MLPPRHGLSAARRWLWFALLGLVVLRLGIATVRGLHQDQGDFYATMPGAYAKTLNPTLWSSEDLTDSWAYGQDVYLYGPTQYLTLWPVIYYFDSYRSIARFLLVVYALLIVGSALVMWRTLQRIVPLPRGVGLAVLVSTCLFFPVIQAYVQREFEIVVLFLKSSAVYFLITRRHAIAAALIAYAAAFKFLPLLWFPYLVARRWTSAIAAFVVVLSLIVGVTHTFLDLSAFGHVWDLAGRELMERTSTSSLCAEWEGDIRHHAVANKTAADVGWALCNFGDRWPSIPVPEMFVAILGTIVAVLLVGFWRLEQCKSRLSAHEEGWRRAIEASVVITVSSVFVYAHYYYLSTLIIPLNVLLVRYLTDVRRSWTHRALWMCAYLCLGAFLVPPSLFFTITGLDFWSAYMRYAVYFYGEMLLIGLLLWEYLTLPTSVATTQVSLLNDRRHELQFERA